MFFKLKIGDFYPKKPPNVFFNYFNYFNYFARPVESNSQLVASLKRSFYKLKRSFYKLKRSFYKLKRSFYKLKQIYKKEVFFIILRFYIFEYYIDKIYKKWN